jgi:hypothetical protein
MAILVIELVIELVSALVIESPTELGGLGRTRYRSPIVV